MKIRILPVIVLIFFHAGISSADDSVKIKTQLIPAKATLGQQVRLIVQVEAPDAYTVQTPSAKEALGQVETVRVETRPPLDEPESVKRSWVFVVRSFELGKRLIGPVTVAYQDRQGRAGQAKTQPQTLEIVGVKRRASDKDGQIRGIKGPVPLYPWRHLAPIEAGLAALLALVLGLKVWLRRRKRKALIDPETLLPPGERAMRELERLQQSGLHESVVKDYYAELSNILRRYLDRRFELFTLESTTSEIVRMLKEMEFERSLVDKIRDILEPSDLVKFAKFIPPRALGATLVQQLTDVVAATKPLPEKAKK